jgi:hypothetical protein
MSRRKVNLVIICEDVQQSTFARRYLAKRGFEPGKIRVRQNPAGKGSGEHFVRQQFVNEVKLFRQKGSYGQGGVAIVALIDADTMSVQERLGQINSDLKQNGLDGIGQDERIAVFIPKRNIETWIRFANGDDVDENIAYPKLEKPRSCKREVDLYVDTICRDGISPDAPLSLIHACDELTKIL